MDSFPEHDHDLRNKLRTWAEQNPLDAATDQEHLEREAVSLARRLGEAGIMAYVVPRSYGGIRETVQAQDLCVIRDELAYFAALADVMFGVQALASQPIVIAGSEEQKKQYLPPLARGETIGAFALTEPGAGSDASAINLSAKKVSGGYALTGTKHFISNTGIAQIYIVFASTDPGASSLVISSAAAESASSMTRRIDASSPGASLSTAALASGPPRPAAATSCSRRVSTYIAMFT